jgi:methionyl-tRNA formyltransferase
MSLRRVVVFTTRADYAVLRGLVESHEALPACEWLVICVGARRTLRGRVRAEWRNLERNGWRWILHRLGAIVTTLTARDRKNDGAPSWPGQRFRLDAVRRLPRLRWLEAPDIHATQVLESVRAFAPDLGLSLAAPILEPALFELPRLGTINLHKGRLPEFRGMPPAFWELVNGARSVGCTVHKVVRELDAGDVLLERTLAIPPHATLRGLQLMLDEAGIELTVEAMRLLDRGEAAWKPQGAGGRTFRKPTLAEEARLRRRMRAGRRDATMRTVLKDAWFWVFCRLLAPPARWWRALHARQRIVVLLYHRVNDDLRDNLTVGIEQFQQQMRWLAASCSVTSLDDITAGRADRRSTRPVVAVTFDDGYLDNYEVAARVLLRERIPATFFVSTGRIGNASGFDHDRRRLGTTLATMTWEHLQRMRDWGFELGSHTVNHIDCGREPLATVRLELEQSRDTLRERLGVARPAFAYPFGGREHCTPAVRELARETGFSALVSAFGGWNDGDIDSFDVRRIGIHHGFSMLAFRARLEGMAR